MSDSSHISIPQNNSTSISNKEEIHLGMLIMRGEPLTKAHEHLIEYAFNHSSASTVDELIIVLGSSFSPRTEKNPFTESERESMIRARFPESKLQFIYMPDFHNDLEWSRSIMSKVNRIKMQYLNRKSAEAKIDLTLFGCRKNSDTSSYYLSIFPENFCKKDFLDQPLRKVTCATDVRASFFSDDFEKGVIKVPSGKQDGKFKEVPVEQMLSKTTIDFLKKFAKTPEYNDLRSEFVFHTDYRMRVQDPLNHFLNHLKTNKRIGPEAAEEMFEMIQGYKKKFRSYPVQGQAVDAVVRRLGEYLLIKRKFNPGKGLWALPGGIVNPDETRFSACLRELKEETNLMAWKSDLEGYCLGSIDKDEPNRDLRIRMFTKAFVFELPDSNVSVFKAGSDAANAQFFSLDEIVAMKSEIYADHISIIREADKVQKHSEKRFY